MECARCGNTSVTITAPTARVIARGGAGVTVEVADSFWQRHPRWLKVQIALYLASLIAGAVGLAVPVQAVSVIAAIVIAIIGGIALFVPPWRERVTIRRIHK